MIKTCEGWQQTFTYSIVYIDYNTNYIVICTTKE